MYSCKLCGKTFYRKGNLRLHAKRKHNTMSPHVYFGDQVKEDEQKKGRSRNGNGNKTKKSKIRPDVDDNNTNNKSRSSSSSSSSSSRNTSSNTPDLGKKSKLYTLRKVAESYSKKFQLGSTVYNFSLVKKIKESTLARISQVLFDVFTSLIAELTANFRSNDMVRIILDNDLLDYPIHIPFSEVSEISAVRIMDEIERVIQSYEDFILDSGFKIDVTHVKMPEGKGRPKIQSYRSRASLDDIERNRECIIRINNRDKMCCARALAVGQVLASCKGFVRDPKFLFIRNNQEQQKRMALELCTKAGVSHDISCTIKNIQQFQSVLKDNRIMVVSKDHLNAIVYDNESKSDRLIVLYYNNNHFDVITRLSTFFKKSYFCLDCKRGYQTKHSHVCGTLCSICKHKHISSPNVSFTSLSSSTKGDKKGVTKRGESLLMGATGTQLLGEFSSCQSKGYTEMEGIEEEVEETETDDRNSKQGDEEDDHADSQSDDMEEEGVDVFSDTWLNSLGDTSNDSEEEGNEWVFCRKCSRSFFGNECYRNHLKKDFNRMRKKKGKSVCNMLKKCSECKKNIPYNRRKAHECGEFYCSTCRDYFQKAMHKCYMLPVKQSEEKEIDVNSDTQLKHPSSHNKVDKTDQIYKLIFFDFECTQESGIHEPNLCIAHRVCEDCMCAEAGPKYSINDSSACHVCGKNEHVFRGDNCATDFCDWLLTKEHQNSIVICHNFKGYDSYFILKYIYSKAIKPSIIFNGSKIMTLSVPSLKIRFLDSLNFLPMPLSNLPRTFNLTELAKGFFPHLFNKKCNENLVQCVLPPKHFYLPENMMPKVREEFERWYDKNLCTSFDFAHELLKYCRSDVDILRRACLSFREIFMEATSFKHASNSIGIDPFLSCITIASACNLVFRSHFLKTDTIAVVPPYTPYDNHSIESIEWLTFLEKSEGIEIQHARKDGGEVRISGAKVDGFDHTSEICYQYHSCFLHGHTCYSPSSWNSLCGATMKCLYEKTLQRDNQIISEGYELITIWSCEFIKTVKQSHDYIKLMNDFHSASPLQPREAFYGGRVDCCKTYYKASDNEVIKYFDFTSLYPYVNKYGLYPLGHHVRIGPEDWQNNINILNIEGLIKCDVLPPRGLYHPVLPYRHGNKLLFPLCRACVELANDAYISTKVSASGNPFQEHDSVKYFEKYYSTFEGQGYNCSHSDKKRVLQGTWVSCELKKALEKGYKIQRVYEAWHFNEKTQYSRTKKKGGLFTSYVNTFLKLKQEKSGLPDWVKSDEDKALYLLTYAEREGIDLDEKDIEKNGGLRTLAKLMLNSFWGKFGQRENMTQSKYITDVKEYMNLLIDDRIIVGHIQLVNDETVYVEYSFKHEFVSPSNRINVVLAAYTTAQARLKLYDLLERLDRRVLYYDTDSVIFVSKVSSSKNENFGDQSVSETFEPQLGDFLGELTNELDTGLHITEFVSTGPKSYSYKLNAPDASGKITHCKVKGIRLSYANCDKVNFASMKDLVHNEILARKEQDCTMVKTINVSMKNQIVRNKHDVLISSAALSKTFQCVYSKRVVQFNNDTLPFGF